MAHPAQKGRVAGLFTKNVARTFLVYVLSLLFGLVTSAIIARWLGPEGKGIMALALLAPGLLSIFLNGGLGTANVYFAGSGRLDVPTLTANSLAYAIPSTILAMAIALGLVASGLSTKLMPGVAAWLILVAVLEFPFRLLIGYFNGILQGRQKITTVNLVTLSDYVLTLILTTVLVIGLQLGLLGALLASLGAVAINFAVVSILVRRAGGIIRPRWSLPVLRTTLSFGLRGYVGNLLQFFNYRLDMFFVNSFLGPAGVGIYSVSVRLAELLWYLPNAVGFVIFPKAAATSPQEMNRFTPRVFRVTLALTAVGALGLAVVGRPVIVLIYSSEFASAYMPMLALLPGVVFLGGGKVLTNEIAGRGYPHYNSINSGASLVVTIILDLLLIPRYQVLGASLASTAAYTITFFTGIVFYTIVSKKAKETSPG